MAELMARDDRDGFAAANLTFHSLIYSGAHNDLITEFATGLRRRLAPFRKAQFRTEGRLPRSQEEHGNVVRAILAGDALAAHAAMFDHMSLVEDSFDRLAAASS
jgi:DNA-binding GntR family transcriptional regulator